MSALQFSTRKKEVAPKANETSRAPSAPRAQAPGWTHRVPPPAVDPGAVRRDYFAPSAPRSIAADVVRQGLSSPSRSLDLPLRARLGPELGDDLEQVRVHSNSAAAAAARAADARAFTVGRDVVFGEAEYAPGTRAGQRLIAHEVVHAIQQRGTGALPEELEVGEPEAPAEAEADALADSVMDGKEAPARARPSPGPSVSRSGRPGTLRRVPAPPAAADGTAAPLDRGKVSISALIDVVSFPAVPMIPQVATVVFGDPAIVHMSWEFYDPSDQMLPGSFSTTPRNPNATTAPFVIGPVNFPSGATQGRHLLRCVGRDAAHKPVAYADRTFFVWTSTPPERLDLAALNATKAAPGGKSLGEVGSAYARAMKLEHQAAVATTGTGKYMGAQNPAAAPAGVSKEDCTTYVLEVLKQAFAAKGRAADWKAVFDEAQRTSAGAFKGTELIKALESKAGWKAVFWAPDPRNPSDALSEHPVAFKEVREKGTYYGIGVEAAKSVIEYRPTSATKREQMTNLDQLRTVPLAVIAAKGGLHMTLLLNGQVYEVHWDRPATDPNVIEATPLEKWVWQSGVVVMPPEDFAASLGR